jgi:hypothetical protein
MEILFWRGRNGIQSENLEKINQKPEVEIIKAESSFITLCTQCYDSCLLKLK